MLAMAEPFLPLLHGCARARVADDRLLKCLGLLLKWPLQGLAKYARRVGKGLLKLLTWASGSRGSGGRGAAAAQNELVQSCLKGARHAAFTSTPRRPSPQAATRLHPNPPEQRTRARLR